MASPERREEIFNQTLKAHDDVQRQSIEARRGIVAESMEIVRSLAVVSTALATGALVLLGTEAWKHSSLIVVGVLILAIEVVVIFYYLLHTQNLAAEKFLKEATTTMRYTNQIILNSRKLGIGEMTGEEFDKQFAELAQEYQRAGIKQNEEFLSSNPRTDNWDLVFFGLLIFALLMLGLGLIFPTL